MQMYFIECSVQGSRFGDRTALLKNSLGVQPFENRADAEAKARELTKKMNHANSIASFTYRAVKGV